MTLKIYPIVLQLVRRLSPYLPALRTRSATLGDQLERALISIPLNLAEARLPSRKKSPSALSIRSGFHAGGTGMSRDSGGARLDAAAGARAQRSVPPRHRHPRPVDRASALSRAPLGGRGPAELTSAHPPSQTVLSS